ncbi:MAG: YbaB/EbfC family nucleoid-associated protein [Candidatus Gastranaerophilales bacterium]|nr:YbaB/EbfC family nucleoid-associated protein [Candidatus Gastranaerophilales bacterium]
MNMIQMMQQAQKMQKKLKDAQESLKEVEVLGQCAGGAVEVTFDGQTKFKGIKIKPEAINPENPESVDKDTLEMLEDLITEAIKDATKKATAEMEKSMKQVTGGISIPGLF